MIIISNYNFLRIEDAGYHRLLIGKTGENEYRSFCFDISKWRKKYPDGMVAAVFKRPDGVTYPVVIEVAGDVVTWTVTSTELVASGRGELELGIYSGEVIGKSASIVTISDVALEPSAAPDEPQLNWIEDVVQRTSQAANEAVAAAEVAVEKAANVKDGISATHSWNGTTLTVTSASGTSSADLKGDKGDKGDPGADGAPGKDGAQGEKGDKGDTGLQGPQGEKGADGAKGEKGDKGEKGESGANGISATHSWNGTTLTVTSVSGTSSADLKGDKGDPGADGAPGKDGAQGEKGDKGDTGLQGPQGEKGADGAKGEKGDKGEKGSDGEKGADGKSAYEYATEAGYSGTEAKFSAKLAELGKSEWQAYVIKEGSSSTIMEVQVISFSGKSAALSGYSLTVGENYIVEWNGKQYECMARSVDGEIYVGDYGLLTSDDTTSYYPFLILYYCGDGGMVFKQNSLADLVTVSISAGTLTVYNKMPKEYLPDSGKLPNPCELKFTGAVSATYDGSKAITVNIPSGGSGGSAEIPTFNLIEAGLAAVKIPEEGEETHWAELEMDVTELNNALLNGTVKIYCNIIVDGIALPAVGFYNATAMLMPGTLDEPIQVQANAITYAYGLVHLQIYTQENTVGFQITRLTSQ